MSPFRLFSIVLFILIGLSVYTDAKRQGRNPLIPLLILGITFIFPLSIIILPIYYLLKGTSIRMTSNKNAPPQIASRMCPKCGHENGPHKTECSNCGNTLAL